MTAQIAVAPAATMRKSQKPAWRKINLGGLGFIVLLALLWELLADTVLARFDNIASTRETIVAMVRLIASGTLLPQVGHTLTVTLIGWVAAVIVGGVIGIWLGFSKTSWRYSMASVEVLRSIPSISFVPVAILLFGFSQTMELVIVIYVCIWPVLVSAVAGVRGVEVGLRDTASTLALGRWGTITKVIIPAAIPRILVGVRLSLGLAIALAVIAEMLGNPAGLGFGIVFVQRAFLPGEVFAYLLAIGIVGWLLNALFTFLFRRLAPRFAGSL